MSLLWRAMPMPMAADKGISIRMRRPTELVRLVLRKALRALSLAPVACFSLGVASCSDVSGGSATHGGALDASGGSLDGASSGDAAAGCATPDASIDETASCPGADTAFPATTVCASGMAFDVRIGGPATGEAVLLLHGFPEGSYEWRFQMHALVAAGYRVVAPDQRGYSPGARPPDTSSYALVPLIEDALGIMDALGISRFHVVGHDWGGAVAWGLALAAPSRVLTLTSVSVPAPGAMATALADTTSCQYGVAAYFADFTGANAEDTYLQDDGAGLHALLSQVQSDAQCVFFDALDSKPALHAALDWYRANTSGRQLVGTTDAHVSVPTLLLWGDQDPYFCRATVDLTSQFVDGPYTLQVLTGVNHWAPELDANTVSTAILAHLAGSDAGPGPDAGPALDASPAPDAGPDSAPAP